MGKRKRPEPESLELRIGTNFEGLKNICVGILEDYKNKVVTHDFICSYFERANDLSREQTEELLKNLVLDNVIMEVKRKSNGLHEYKLTGKKTGGGEARAGALASVPCGACPHIGICSPDGAISPTTCTYFQKWLDF
ncbi:unnamed protein product [Microthlaspi erraticum]|uniref:DNA-directed RNA polymerase III subunit RPC6 n=1 Tax=Microthlaspi erraticum TaxID=1685480 RepID=A0A6D2KST1_9BRAS|nr:unnamed protein product [Microthlaspi erraticum]